MDIRRFELGHMAAAERGGFLRTLAGIPCKNEQNEGIGAAYIKRRLRDLRGDVWYGPEGGVRRRVREVLVLYTARYTRSGEPVATAYALVCDGGPMFHRLRQAHVDRSVYLAMLCGRGASHIVRRLVEMYTRRGVAITLDALPHVVSYYVRDKMPPTVMIDTKRAFELSLKLRAAPSEATVASMVKQIAPGEAFVPLAERAYRGRASPDHSYEVARMVVLPESLRGLTFAELCYKLPSELPADARELTHTSRPARATPSRR
jgi:hypothetical protein